MTGYGVVHRITVYSGSSDSTVLFKAHSQAGQTNPYLSDVRITGRRIHVPEGSASPGQASFRLLDKRTASGDQSDRWLTEFLGDSENRNALRSSRIEVDVSDDGGVSFQREFTGRMHDVDQVSKTEFEVLAGDLRTDELDEIFDGTEPDVDWAEPPVFVPLGHLDGRRFGYHPTRFAPPATWKTAEVSSPGGWTDSHRIIVGTKIARTRVTDTLRDHAAYTTRPDTDQARPPIAPDLRVAFRPAGENTYRKFSVGTVEPIFNKENRGRSEAWTILTDREDPEHLAAVAVEVLDGDDTAPSDNTAGNFWLYSVAPPTEKSPLHIGTGTSNSGVHWATMVSGIAHGTFGGQGFDIDYPRFNELIQDQTQPRVRHRITEGPVSALEWLEENTWPVVGHAPSITASGTLYPVSYDPPDSAAGLFEFTDQNTKEARWSQSRTGQINHVRFETVREASITPKLSRPDDPTDLIVEHDGDRIIVAKDTGKKRRQFKVEARGLRPPRDGDGGFDSREYAEERALRILDRFQDGPQTVELHARRTDGTKGTIVGDHVKVSVPWLPDLRTKLRGGTRLMLVTEKSVETDGTYRFRLLDAGDALTADAPTIDGLDRNTTEPKHAYDVTITPPGDPERAVIEVATVESGGSEPSGGSELWSPAVSVSGDAQQTVTIGQLASRRTHWFRSQGRGPGKIASSFTSALSGTTNAIDPPTGASVTISGTAAVLTWTVGDTNYPLMPVLDSDEYLDDPLDPESTRFTFTELDENSDHDFGIKHNDRFGGDSTTATASSGTATGDVLSSPRHVTILQGRGDVDRGTPRNPELGTGVEVKWAKTEPYAETVLHHDDNSSFTSPTAVSGIETDRTRVSLPLDDTTRFFRVFHQRDGWTTSPASEAVSAKPVAFTDDPSLADGFPGGVVSTSLDTDNDIILSVSTGDPDVDAAYYTLNTTGFSEPDTNANEILRSEMPYSEDQGVIADPPKIAYLWLKFWSSTSGFGQGVKKRITAGGALIPQVDADPTQSGNTGSLDLTITDLNRVVTAVEFQKKTGTGDYNGSWLTSWDRSSGTIGTTQILTRGEDISLIGKHNASIKWRVQYTDVGGDTRTIGNSHTFDSDEIAEITGIEIDFDEDGHAVVSVTADEDAAGGNIYVTVGGGSTPSDPTAGSNDGTIPGRSGSVDTGVKITTGNEAIVKAAAEDSDGNLGPVQQNKASRRIGPFGKDTTTRSVTGTTTETTLETITVPANKLGSNGGLRLTARFTGSGINGQKTLRVKFGGDEVATTVIAASDAQDTLLKLLLFNDGATNDQSITDHWIKDIGGKETFGGDSSAQDTTTDTDLTITAELADSSDQMNLVLSFAEFIGTD